MDLKFAQTVIITDEDIDDIVCTALEGGINYWCKRASVVGEYRGTYASDQISKNGVLILTAYEEPFDNGDTEFRLTKSKLMRGIKMYLENPKKPYDILDVEHGKTVLNTGMVDAVVADMIVQYAVFDEIIFG